MFKRNTSSSRLFSPKKRVHNHQCPLTCELISDLIREDPSLIVVFKNSQGKFFAYHSESLKEWYKTRAQDRLQTTPNANQLQIIFQDLLTTEPLTALNIKFINNELILSESHKIIVLIFFFSQIILVLNVIDINIQRLLLMPSTILMGIVMAQTFSLFRNYTPISKEEQFEKIFNKWFEQTFVKFSPAQYKVAEEVDAEIFTRIQQSPI